MFFVITLRRVWALVLRQWLESSHMRRRESLACSLWWLGGPAIFLLISGGLQRRSGSVWSQHTPGPPFSVRSLEVEMLEREIMCLMSVALALVFPVAVKCCPGFPSSFPESRPSLLSLGAVVIPHSLHVMSSVSRAQLGCP